MIRLPVDLRAKKMLRQVALKLREMGRWVIEYINVCYLERSDLSFKWTGGSVIDTGA